MTIEIGEDLDCLMISMPWATLNPGIQLGIMQTILDEAGIKSASLSANVEMYAFLKSRNLVKRVADYSVLCLDTENAEWAFVDGPESLAVAEILGERYEAIEAIRKVMPEFMEELAAAVIKTRARVVGFSITTTQLRSSLALAAMLKRLNPDLKIVLGGTALRHGAGDSVLELFPCVDAVYYGDAEILLPAFITSVLGNGPKLPNVSWRRDGAVELAASINKVEGIHLPMPLYDEFFGRVERLQVPEVKVDAYIMFETGRGCWWGYKHACLFCADDVFSTPYRVRPFSVVVAEMKAQAERYCLNRLHTTDSIIDFRSGKEYLKAVADLGFDFDLFFSIKSNTDITELKLLADAGAKIIIPGIESLSTSILKSMDKGVTTIQNVRCLKFCKWYGIKLSWSLIIGFIGETAADYAAMEKLCYNIMHLCPPSSIVPFELYRGSKLFCYPKENHIEIQGPITIYRHLYSVDATDFAYRFNYAHTDEKSGWREYTKDLHELVWKWERLYNQRRDPSLCFARIGKCIQIADARPDRNTKYYLSELEASAYHMCFDIISEQKIVDALGSEAATALDWMEERGLVFRENNQVLALAIPVAKP